MPLLLELLMTPLSPPEKEKFMTSSKTKTKLYKESINEIYTKNILYFSQSYLINFSLLNFYHHHKIHNAVLELLYILFQANQHTNIADQSEFYSSEIAASPRYQEPVFLQYFSTFEVMSSNYQSFLKERLFF